MIIPLLLHFDVDEEEDEFAASLLSHPTVGMKQALTPGIGVLVNSSTSRVAKRDEVAEKLDTPVYSLRRLVPPGR